MSTLADKIRSARKIEQKIGDITFTGIRATSEQMHTYYANNMSFAQICRLHINGCSGAKESDFVPGGSDNPVEFDQDAFNEAVGDRKDWWTPLSNKILQDASERLEVREDSKKK